MKIALDCLCYSLKFLKLNFSFIVILQVIKFLLIQENSKALLNFNGGLTRNRSLLNLDEAARRPSETKTSQIEYFRRKLDSKFFISLSSWYSYDIKQMEATRTEILDIITDRNGASSINAHYREEEAVDDDHNHDLLHHRVTPIVKRGTGNNDKEEIDNPDETLYRTPILVSTSYVNFKELLQFSNLKNMIRLAILLNLNMTSMLVNLLILSYLLVKYKSIFRLNRTFASFLRCNFKMNIVLFFTLIVINGLYLIVINNYSESNLSKTTSPQFDISNMIRRFVEKYTIPDEKESTHQPSDQFLSRLQVREKIAKIQPASSSSPLWSQLAHSFLITNAKLNVFFMLVAICLLFVYGFLLKIDSERPSPSSSQTNIINEKSALSLIESAEKKTLPMPCEDETMLLQNAKCRKIEKNGNLDLQWIVHSLLCIYLLSVWDVADIYHHYRSSSRVNNNVNNYHLNLDSLFNQSSSGNFKLNENHSKNPLIILNKLNYDYINKELTGLFGSETDRVKELHNLTRNQPPGSNLILNKVNNFYYDYQSKMLRHTINFHSELEYEGAPLRQQHHQKQPQQQQQLVKSVTKIKVLLVLKRHTQLFGDLLIICFSAIILIKLNALKRLNELYRMNNSVNTGALGLNKPEQTV